VAAEATGATAGQGESRALAGAESEWEGSWCWVCDPCWFDNEVFWQARRCPPRAKAGAGEEWRGPSGRRLPQPALPAPRPAVPWHQLGGKRRTVTTRVSIRGPQRRRKLTAMWATGNHLHCAGGFLRLKAAVAYWWSRLRAAFCFSKRESPEPAAVAALVCKNESCRQRNRLLKTSWRKVAGWLKSLLLVPCGPWFPRWIPRLTVFARSSQRKAIGPVGGC